MKNEKKCQNLSLVISMEQKNHNRDRKLVGARKTVNWSKMSTSYSKFGVETALEEGLSLEQMGERVHDNWMIAVSKLWFMIDVMNYSVEGGYTAEKRASHETMCVEYANLPRDEQLKDLFVAKTLLSESDWKRLSEGTDVEREFEERNIGW